MLLAPLTALIFVGSVLSSSFQGRQVVDVCGFVEAELIVDGILFGNIELCICLNLLDGLIETNDITKNAAAKTSTKKVKSALEDILYEASRSQNCFYPPNSSPVCTEYNPCAFECDSGYSRLGDSCVPPPGNSGGFKKRSTEVCSSDLTRCGVWSSWGTRSYECLDTEVELESCGGCVVPFGDEETTGQDCSQIKGVSDVECAAGRCIVTECRPGYLVSKDGASCTPLHHGSHQHVANTTVGGGQHLVESILHHSSNA